MLFFLIENRCRPAHDRLSITATCSVFMAAGTLCTKAISAVFLMSCREEGAGSVAEREKHNQRASEHPRFYL